MVDAIRIARLLRSLSDNVSRLEREANADQARRRDPIWLPGVKYLFVAAIEACVDVAQHIDASEGWGPPADNGDAVRLLAAHGVLDAGLAEQIRRAVGFRNVLVHGYVEVDDEVVQRRLMTSAICTPSSPQSLDGSAAVRLTPRVSDRGTPPPTTTTPRW